MSESNSSLTQAYRSDADKPVFEALLTPHRSLGRTGFIVLMLIATAMTTVQAALFIVSGAWPVGAYFGLDLVLLFGAFVLNYRAALAREIVSISRTALSIVKYAPSGRKTDFRTNPFWARFNVRRHAEIGIVSMSVSGQGRTTEVGSFLNPEDRESFASAFAGALAKVKRG